MGEKKQVMNKSVSANPVRTGPLFVSAVLCVILYAVISASPKAVAGDQIRSDVIRFGIYEQVLLESETENIRAAIEYWIKKFANSVNLQIDGKVYLNEDSLVIDFEEGKLDYIHMTPNKYFKAINKLEGDIAPLPVQGGKKLRTYLLIVRQNSRIETIFSLRDKILAIPKDDDVGRLFLNMLLLKNRMKEMQRNFSEVIETRTFAQAILAVFFGKADVCLVSDYSFDTVAEMNPQIKRKLNVLLTSPGFCYTVGLYRKNLDEHIKQILTDYMCHFLNDNPAGEQVKILFLIEGMSPGDPSDLESYKQLYEEYSRCSSRQQTQQARYRELQRPDPYVK